MKKFLEAREEQRDLRDRHNQIVTRLRPFVDDVPNIRVRYSQSDLQVHDILIEPTKNGFDLVFAAGTERKSHPKYWGLGHRLPTMVLWRMRADPSVGTIRVHVSDGDRLTKAGFLFSSFLEDKSLVPDTYFQETHGFDNIRNRISALDIPWAQRSADLVWRGGPNGSGFLNVYPELGQSPATVQRVRFAWFCKDTDVDFGFVMPQQSEFYPQVKAAGLMKDRVEPETWFGRKYAIDLDGHTNAWDNFYHRLLMGCCVFKVAGDYPWRQWYYHKLKPWEHYVPVAADFSDFNDRLAWAKEHDKEAQEIAENGRTLALSMTYDSEAELAGQIITENWERYL